MTGDGSVPACLVNEPGRRRPGRRSMRDFARAVSDANASVPPLRDPNADDSEEDQVWEEDCNYDINPTHLFRVLEGRNWDEAAALLDGSDPAGGTSVSVGNFG